MVRNPTGHPLLLQFEAFDWSQDDGADRLKPTQALIVNPPIFELAPGTTQVVRVGLPVFVTGVATPPAQARWQRNGDALELRLPAKQQAAHHLRPHPGQPEPAGGGVQRQLWC